MTDTSTSIVIFGASGDLTNRKLVPALLNNFAKGRLPEDFRIVGVSRTAFSHDEFRAKMQEGSKQFAPMQYSPEIWAKFAPHIFYIAADAGQVDDMSKVESSLHELENGNGADRLYYLSVAPTLYPTIIANLKQHKMSHENGLARRIIIEKPFGTDLETAKQLNKSTHAAFDERQVYRIDHYLGKETAQNILYLRFANAIYEPIWNRTYIDNVQITVAESVDVGTRAEYYDHSGVIRDMFQNHLLQLLTLVAMEVPSSLEADELRNEKVKVLRSVRSIALSNTVRAQYDGYRQAEGVAPESPTPTYAALKLYIDNWRWEGVPFYLRSGKALNSKTSEIVIEFKCPPHVMLRLDQDSDFEPNILRLRIQPDEGINLSFQAKIPDRAAMQSVRMEFEYDTSFKGQNIPEAYERLLLDALHGDAALFNRSDEIEAAWTIMDRVIQGWVQDPTAPSIVTYGKGSGGPAAAEDLLKRDGRIWR